MVVCGFNGRFGGEAFGGDAFVIPGALGFELVEIAGEVGALVCVILEPLVIGIGNNTVKAWAAINRQKGKIMRNIFFGGCCAIGG